MYGYSGDGPCSGSNPPMTMVNKPVQLGSIFKADIAAPLVLFRYNKKEQQ